MSVVIADHIWDSYYIGFPCKEDNVSVCIYCHKLILCCLFLTMKHSCGCWSLVVCIFVAGVHVFGLLARWLPQNSTCHAGQTASDTLYSFIHSCSHHVICQSHQIILYARHLWHICPLRSLSPIFKYRSPGPKQRCLSWVQEKMGGKTDH